MKKKHKGRSNNDRGAVLSLDDVKHHVSRLLPSTLNVSDCTALTGAKSFLLCLCWTHLVPGWCWWGEQRHKREHTEMEGFRDLTVKWGDMTGMRWREKRRVESGLNLIKAAGQERGQARIKSFGRRESLLNSEREWNQFCFNSKSACRRGKRERFVPPDSLSSLVFSLFFSIFLPEQLMLLMSYFVAHAFNFSLFSLCLQFYLPSLSMSITSQLCLHGSFCLYYICLSHHSFFFFSSLRLPARIFVRHQHILGTCYLTIRRRATLKTSLVEQNLAKQQRARYATKANH